MEELLGFFFLLLAPGSPLLLPLLLVLLDFFLPLLPVLVLLPTVAMAGCGGGDATFGVPPAATFLASCSALLAACQARTSASRMSHSSVASAYLKRQAGQNHFTTPRAHGTWTDRYRLYSDPRSL